jgi:hypothetical protein
MPSYTNSLRLVQPATGEYSGTWGTEVNNGLTALVDASIAGTSNITMTAANFTLTSNNGAADQSRAMFLVLGGTPGGSYQVICPAVSKLYFVTNNTGFAQTVKTSTGSGISVPTNRSMTLRCDGTDVVAAQNYFASLTLGAALPVNSGGTGLTSYTSGGVVYASSTSALATNSSFLFDGTNLCVGKIAVSAWGPNQSAIEVGTDAALVNDVTGNGLSGLMHNLLLNASGYSFKIGGPAYAGAYLFSRGTGSHQWLNSSAAGTVPATATMVQAMTLNASGNLGLGNTPSASIAGTTIEVGVNKSGAFGALGSGPVDNAYVSANAYPTVSADPAFTSWKYTRTGFAAKYELGNGGAHRWYTAPSGTAGAAISFTQAMTLTNGGDFGINGTPPNDSQFYSKNDGANRFAGTFENHSASGLGMSIGTASTVLAHFYPNAIRTGSPVGSITTNGTSTSYVTSSDSRLKDNIVPAPSASDVIDAIQIVSHDWKAAPDEHVTYGVIAQDLHAVAPQAVLQGDDGEEVEKTWGVDYSKLVPMLIKEIQSLRARVAALEQA